MFKIETLEQLVQRARRAFRTHLPGSDAWLWPNNINPTAKVIGGMTNQVMEFADYIQRQKFAITADAENLVLHGEEYGIVQKPAAPASGQVTVTAAAAVTVAVGAVFARTDGVQYFAVNGAASGGAGDLTFAVIAATDGQATNAVAGTPLTIVSGVTGDDDATAAVASSDIVNGADIEDTESFRARILFRKRNVPMGGAAADYVAWAGEVAGVSFLNGQPSVFVERLWNGPGSVRVFPLMFDLYATGIPLIADVVRVHDFIETVRPAGAVVTVQAPVAVPVDIMISGLQPDNAAVRDSVTAELRAAFQRLARVAGSDQNISGMPYLAYPTSFSCSWIWQAVANASGEQRHSIAAPAADIALTAGQMATLGTVTFT